jgi:hypothetical protein
MYNPSILSSTASDRTPGRPDLQFLLQRQRARRRDCLREQRHSPRLQSERNKPERDRVDHSADQDRLWETRRHRRELRYHRDRSG